MVVKMLTLGKPGCSIYGNLFFQLFWKLNIQNEVEKFF